MNVTREVITDLLPVYFAKECSQDTKLLVEEFFKANPEFERQAKDLRTPFPSTIPHGLEKEDEMKSLAKARRLLRVRSSIMAFAILCSIAPFTFLYTEGKFHWMFSESPGSAMIYGILAFVFWVVYVFMKRKMNDL